MSEIDWSKRPNGTFVWVEVIGSERPHDGGWHYEAEDKWIDSRGNFWPKRCEREGTIRIHHKPETPAWNGEGLPPVGTVCETWFDDGKACWHECEVIHHKSDDHRLAAVILRGQHKGRLCWGMDFRPIRTPEQIAAEEREKGIAAILSAAGVTGSAFSDDPEAAVWAAALYDAGYRKVDNP